MNKCRKKVNTKKWSDLKQIFSFKEGGYLKSETSVEILIEFPLIWYMVVLCRSHLGRVVLI